MELWDLVLVYSRLLKSTRLDASMTILYGDTPIEQWIQPIRKALAERESVAFFDLVGRERDRSRVVGTFLAVLQLARDGELRILQDADLQDMKLVTASATPGTI